MPDKEKPREKPKPEDLGAGRYKVTAPFVYQGKECKVGEELDMSDGGAGAHWDKVEKITVAAKAKPAAKEPQSHAPAPHAKK
jgi:hypothetical protein